MKTIKMFVVLASLTFGVIATSFASPVLNLIRIEGEKLMVAYKNETASRIVLTISDNNSRVVYYKASVKPVADFRALYDLSNLESGTYTFQVNVNGNKISRVVDINQSALSIGEQVLNDAPFFSLNDRKLDISFLNHEQENLNFAVYKNNVQVYDSELGNDFVIQNRFDVSKLPAGNYRFVIQTASDAYSWYATL